MILLYQVINIFNPYIDADKKLKALAKVDIVLLYKTVYSGIDIIWTTDSNDVVKANTGPKNVFVSLVFVFLYCMMVAQIVQEFLKNEHIQKKLTIRNNVLFT